MKICDFGLARDIYKDPDYVRKGSVSAGYAVQGTGMDGESETTGQLSSGQHWLKVTGTSGLPGHMPSCQGTHCS